MPLYRDEGVVLRTVKLGEADRILTILTRAHGKVRAVAKGVRRTKSRFGGRLEPFMRVDLLIATGRSLDVVSQAASIAVYAGTIGSDYDSYTAASAIAETADRVVAAEHQPVPDQYRLLVGALAALARHAHAPRDIGGSYVMRALALAGWRPRLGSCVVCGAPVGASVGRGNPDAREAEERRSEGSVWFSVAGGGVMCDADRTPDARAVGVGALRRLAALTDGDWTVLDGDRAGAGSAAVGRAAASGSSVHAAASPEAVPMASAVPASAMTSGMRDSARLVEEWSTYYLERPIRSLRWVDS